MYSFGSKQAKTHTNQCMGQGIQSLFIVLSMYNFGPVLSLTQGLHLYGNEVSHPTCPPFCRRLTYLLLHKVILRTELPFYMTIMATIMGHGVLNVAIKFIVVAFFHWDTLLPHWYSPAGTQQTRGVKKLIRKKSSSRSCHSLPFNGKILVKYLVFSAKAVQLLLWLSAIPPPIPLYRHTAEQAPCRARAEAPELSRLFFWILYCTQIHCLSNKVL